MAPRVPLRLPLLLLSFSAILALLFLWQRRDGDSESLPVPHLEEPWKDSRPHQPPAHFDPDQYGPTTATSTSTLTPLEHDHPFVPLTHSPSGDTPLEATETAVVHDLPELPTHVPWTADPPPNNDYDETQVKIQDLRKEFPVPEIEGHWPPYEDYRDADYDPNLWEQFNYNLDLYTTSGIGQVDAKPEPYLPYPTYNSPAWSKRWRGTYNPCEGPRGKLLNESDEDIVKSYGALTSAFPNPIIGDHNATGIAFNRCVDRYRRYGPYGHGQQERDAVKDWQRPMSRPDWSSVDWKLLQDQCLIANKDRYAPTARQTSDLQPGKKLPNNPQLPAPQVRTPSYHDRTAILVRVWEGYNFTEDDMHNIRALVTELSLQSGGEYSVYFLMEVTDPSMDTFSTQSLYDDILKTIPKELRSITILWSQKLCEEWYRSLGDYDPYWHPYLAVQWFSITHPEYAFVWNWHADVRYTGNFYEVLEGISRYAKRAPRKFLWERNQRSYVHAVHGTYEEFVNATNTEIEASMRRGKVKTIWGPQKFLKTQQPLGPKPPTSIKNDDFAWGVGDDADLITLQPIWDPAEVEWDFKEKIWNFVPGIKPVFSEENPMASGFHHPEFPKIPRRATIGTHVRLSRTLLHAMHQENLAGRTMAGEMWAPTVALHHGLKAVYAPLPTWTDRDWPAWYLDAILNANRGEAAQWSQRNDSVWARDRSHNLAGTSWFVAAEFPKTLYRRWLGFRRSDTSPLAEIGGKEWEDDGVLVDLPGEDGKEFEVRVGGQGRMCLPPMLLHPIKEVFEEEVIEKGYVPEHLEDGNVEGLPPAWEPPAADPAPIPPPISEHELPS